MAKTKISEPGRPAATEPPREKLSQVTFKLDSDTAQALDRLVAVLAPRGVQMRPKSAVIRRLILEADAALGAKK
jgi:hypothetical protein